ncbi:hypothetical protein [Gimesia chilikensis]|uniref:hypothetical protein n=1 Tax=Gimesia chilikensis TaxID=2605989 RepID=UPI0018D6BC78|nr:hypothetical protein [Gimesia chilikensis]
MDQSRLATGLAVHAAGADRLADLQSGADQAGLTYQKQGKRCFLLVTPSLPQVGDKKE